MWWNGRHAWLRAMWARAREGSTPFIRTSAPVVELAYTLVLGTSAERIEGSNPSRSTSWRHLQVKGPGGTSVELCRGVHQTLSARHSLCRRQLSQGIAQPGSAPRSERGGRRFKSCCPDTPEPRSVRHTWGYSSVGRAPALQAGGRGFEPRLLHSVSSRMRGHVTVTDDGSRPTDGHPAMDGQHRSVAQPG